MVQLTHFGIGEGNPEEVARGKRRTVTYLAFSCFAMLVAAASNTPWVSGGLEFTFSAERLSSMNSNQLSALEADVAYVSGSPNKLEDGLEKMLGADLTQTFTFSLTQGTQGTASAWTYSGQNILRTCAFDLSPYVVEINAMAADPNCTAGFRNPWCGAKPVDINVFNAASGLLGFSAFLQLVFWITLVSQALEVPYLGNHKYVFETAVAAQGGAAFFSLIAWAQFIASGLKTEVCAALDPDEQYDGLPCTYGSGFDTAVAASIIGFINLAAFVYWMPRSIGNKYEFSAPLGKAGYDPVGTESTGSAAPAVASTGGGYQDFGSSSTAL